MRTLETHIPEEVGYFAFENVSRLISVITFLKCCSRIVIALSSNPGEWIPWDGTLKYIFG
ncbi:hypothetical protein O9929_01705 [Vibrio lentus]|nr:hypothetical protein [Vibrio lentus]